MARQPLERALLTPAMLLGMGMGGFFDGILFHQILQIHNMLSAIRPPDNVIDIEINMFWDGLFHSFTWTVTLVGIALLWRLGQQTRGFPWPTRMLVGGMLMGWGVFNTVEGIIDHLVLQIHHVVERFGLSVYDGLFVASGLIMLIVGRLLVKRGAALMAEAKRN